MEAEQYSPPQVPQSSNKAALKLLGIELGILIILILIVVGVFNYFNIFSLSKNNPDLFGFLPHQPFEATPAPTVVPANTAQLIPTSQKINDPKIEAEIDTFSKRGLVTTVLGAEKPEYSVQEIENKYGYKYYGAYTLHPDGVSILAMVGYDSNKVIVDNHVHINHIPKGEQVLDNDSSNFLVSKYLQTQARGTFKCENPNINSNIQMLCRAFWGEGDTKKGVDIIQIGGTEFSLHYCEIPSTSSYYNVTSCDYD